MPKEERTREEPVVVEAFPGYYRTSEGDEHDAPQGSLAKSNGTRQSEYFTVSNHGTIVSAPGVSSICVAGATSVRTPFWWDRSRGGSVAIIEGVAGLLGMDPGPPQGVWTALAGDSDVTLDHRRTRYGSFFAYGDWLYYANGVDQPIKIRRHDLKAYKLGLEVMEDTERPSSSRVAEATLGGNGLLVGTYKYKFTYTYVGGGESNENIDPIIINVPGRTKGLPQHTKWIWGPWWNLIFQPTDADETKVVRGTVLIDGFPTVAEFANLRDDIAWINVYRTFRGGDEYYYVGRVRRGEQSYLDSTPDSLLGGAIRIDHDMPPVGRFVAIHADRLWMVGDKGTGSGDMVSYSLKGLPDIFPPSYRIPQSEWVNAGRCTGLSPLAGVLHFFFERGTFRLEGEDPDSYHLAPIAAIGCTAPATVRVYNDTFMFLSGKGLTQLRGEEWKVLDVNLDFDLMGEFQWQDPYWACGAIVGDTYILSYSKADGQSTGLTAGANNRTFSINLKNGGVGLPGTPFDMASSDGPNGFPLITRFHELNANMVYSLGRMHKHDDNIVSHTMKLMFHPFNLGTPDQKKQLDTLEIDLVGHTLSDYLVIVADDQGREQSFDVSGTDLAQWALTPEWSTTETYPRRTLFTISVSPAKAIGRRFWLYIQEQAPASFMPSRETEIVRLKFFANFIKRRGGQVV